MSAKCLKNALILSVILWFGILLLVSMVHAQSVTVAWDTYTDVRATELRIYVATTPGGTQFPIKVTPISLTQYTIPATAFTTNTSYIRLTAWGSVAGESDPSNEVIYTKPTTTTTAAVVTTSIPTTTTTSILPLVKPSNLRIKPL